MTNLDYIIETFEEYKNNALTSLSCYICGKRLGLASVTTYDHCNKYNCDDCTKSLIWLKEPYRPKIKLKQWEYDLLNIYAIPNIEFKKDCLLGELSAKGYFKGIEDTSMTPKEILNNCEVVE